MFVVLPNSAFRINITFLFAFDVVNKKRQGFSPCLIAYAASFHRAYEIVENGYILMLLAVVLHRDANLNLLDKGCDNLMTVKMSTPQTDH